MVNLFPVRNAYAIPLLVTLLGFLIYRGIIPAFTIIDSDFPNYYTAGKIAAQGTDVEKLYDDTWFQDQIRANGMALQGKFSPFPPPTALMFIPFSSFSPMTSLRIVTSLNIVALGLSILLLAKYFRGSLRDSALLILLSGIGLANCLRLGQVYIVLSCLTLLGYYLFTRNQPFLSGLSFGVLVPMKYYPVIFVLYFAWLREWKVVLGSLVAIVAVCLSSIAILGWPIHEAFLRGIPGGHLQGALSLQDPFSSSFQSFESLLKRVFVFDAVRNPAPSIDSSAIYVAMKTVILSGLIGIAVYFCIKTRRVTDMSIHQALFGVIGVLGLLVAPATATYHFILYWLPAGLLLSAFTSWGHRRGFLLFILVYSIIGFIPYGFFRRFDGDGLLTVLAYPRLFLVALLFSISVFALRSRIEKPAIAGRKLL